MFSTINEGLVALKAKAISELKPETKLLLETTFINGSTKKLDSAVNAWLTKITKNPKVLLIQGTAGSGKTQFCQKLTISLWKQDLDDKPIPLYIKLASLTNPKTRAIEETLEKVGFTQEQIIILKKQHTFIFILDGYDELYEFSNLHLTNGLNNWQAHTIITCRSEALYFITDYEKYFVPFKANKRLAIGLQQIDIKPLSLLQIEEFLNNHIKDNQNGITDEELTNIPGLLSLVQTPLLLKAILAVQKYSLISPIDFYKVLIEARFLWQEQKLKLNKLIEQTIDFKRYFWSYCKNLALKMQELGTSFIYHRKSTLSLFEDYPEKSNWASFLQGDNKIQYMFAACPLVKTKDNRIEFIDYCLIDYFIGSFRDEVDLFPTPQPIMPHLQPVLETESSPLPIIGRISFTMQIGKIQQLVDRIKENSKFKESLFKYIELSKTDEKYAIAAANAITGLNFAHICFSGKDFKEIKIPGADLTGAILDNVDLEGADLREARLKVSWLQNANLKRAKMDNCLFEELAYKKVYASVYRCYYSSDGKYFAATGDKKIKIYSVDRVGNFTEIDSITTDNEIRSCCFSPNNKHFAVAAGNNVTIHSRNEITVKDSFKKSSFITFFKTLTGHTDPILSVMFSFDNQWLVSGSWDKTVRLWSLTNPNNHKTLTGHRSLVNSVTFSHDNQWLASGSSDCTVRLWNLNDPNNSQSLTGHTNEVNSVAFSHDNQWLASGSSDCTVRLWSLIDSNNKQTLTGHTSLVNSVMFSFDNQWLASSGSHDHTIRLWSLTNPNDHQTLAGHTSFANSVVFSPDSQWLASGSSDCTVRLWRLTDSNNRKTLAGHTDSVNSVTFSHDNQWLASGSNDCTVRLWRLTDPNNNQSLVGHKLRVTSVTFSFDSQWLASVSHDQTVRLWNLTDPNNNQTLIGHTNDVTSVTFSFDNQWLASGSRDCTVRLWSLTDSNNNQTLTVHTSWVNSVAFSFDNKWLASAGAWDKTVHLWNLTEPNSNQTLTGHTRHVNSVTFSFDNQWLASGSSDCTVRFWSLNTPDNNQTLTGHTRDVNSITFSFDNQWLASGSNAEIIFWNRTLNGNIQWHKKFIIPNNFNLLSIAYSPTHGRLILAVGGKDHSVRLFEQLNDNKLMLLWNSHQIELYSYQADITLTRLSATNAELLTQRGAIGTPTIIEDEPLPLADITKTITEEISEKMSNLKLTETETETETSKPLLFSKTLNQAPTNEPEERGVCPQWRSVNTPC